MAWQFNNLFVSKKSNIYTPELTKASSIAASKLTALKYFSKENIETSDDCDELKIIWTDTMEALDKYCTHIVRQYDTKIASAVSQAVGQVLDKASRLMPSECEFPGIATEAELRYVICDPVMEAICRTWKLKIRLEESLKHSEEATGAAEGEGTSPPPPNIEPRALRDVISEQSKPDYTCYSIYGNSGNVVAMVIEAKLSECAHTNKCDVEAQTIGYMIRLRANISAPIGVVITEKWIQILLFPFENEDCDPLEYAIVFNEMNIWEEHHPRFNSEVLELLLILCCPYDRKKLMVTLGGGPKREIIGECANPLSPKALQDQLLAELRDEKDKEIKKLRDEKDKEIKKLRDEKDKEIKKLRDEKDKEIKELCTKLTENLKVRKHTPQK